MQGHLEILHNYALKAIIQLERPQFPERKKKRKKKKHTDMEISICFNL